MYIKISQIHADVCSIFGLPKVLSDLFWCLQSKTKNQLSVHKTARLATIFNAVNK